MNPGAATNAGAAVNAGAALNADAAVTAVVSPKGLLLRVADLRVDFGAHAAVRDVTFDLFAGETLGLVGESGSGKSTLARAILRLVRSSKGSVVWRGQDLLACEPAALRPLRRDLQIVFQDPLASLNPRMTVGETIAEPLRIFEPALNAPARRSRVGGMLERVGLAAGMMNRYPHEFSGGQCQRIGIARAMILGPKLLVCDEPVSSLDVSVQGQIVNLLLDLQRDAGTAMLFISHNLAVVRHLSHRILVMYSGRLVEIAPRDALFAAPVHPYTRALLAAVPTLPPAHENAVGPLRLLPMPSPPARAEPAGDARASRLTSESSCAFRDRCSYAMAVCGTTVPPLEEVAAGHWVACHRSRELIHR
jgi:oligopeptide transport system ATP-binding protein